MLGDAHAGGGGDEGSEGGNVDRVVKIAAGADNVEHGLGGDAVVDAHAAVAHGAGETGELGGGFAFDAEGGEECRQARRRDLAAQDELHGGVRLRGGQVTAIHHLVEGLEKGHGILNLVSRETRQRRWKTSEGCNRRRMG